MEEIQGDLFESFSSLAHCVSECLTMGKGIATEFKKRFGGVDELKSQKKTIGETAVLQRDERFIFYLITKQKYYHKPTPDDFICALQSLSEECRKRNVRFLSIPRLGCGLDRLEWPWVKEQIEKTFKDHPTIEKITVFSI